VRGLMASSASALADTANLDTYAGASGQPISPRNFQRLAAFVYQYSGIKLPPSKQTMVEGRLKRRLRALQIATLDAYCAYLFEKNGLEDESIHLIDSLTTNKTDFFREPAHFDFLARHVLPALVSEQRNPIKVWSAACASGAEPYTLAMVIDAFLSARGPSTHGRTSYSILATDLCTEVLDVAQRGVYPQDVLSPTPEPLRQKYVRTSKDRSAGLCRIAPSLRGQVGFARLNLMDQSYAVGRDMDAIFCRNVLIYFDKPTQQAVLTKLCSHLRVGGYLFLGHSESVAGLSLPIEQVANTIFQRR